MERIDERPLPERRRYDESLRRDLRTFRLFTHFHAWLPREFLRAVGDLYWEYPAFLGQGLFYALFLSLNTALRLQGIDTAASVPGVFYFAFNILTLDFFREPYMVVFLSFAFLLSWSVNKLVLILAPRVRNSPVPVLLAATLVSGVASLAVFSIVFAYIVGAVV